MKTALDRRKSSSAAGRIALVLATTLSGATLLALAACDAGGHDGKAPASSAGASAPAPSVTTGRAPDQDDKLALQLLNNIIQGEFSTVREHFDATMQRKLSCDKLSSGWADYQQTFGSYQSHGDPQDVSRGDLTVVNVPLHMAQLPGEFRVTFHGDGTVAGLFFLRTGVPVP